MVRLSEVECHAGALQIFVRGLADERAADVTLTASACVPGTLAKLDGWLALRTPLLMVIDQGDADVYGPDGELKALRVEIQVR